jgi:uncharacterized protein (DUF1810 family)
VVLVSPDRKYRPEPDVLPLRHRHARRGARLREAVKLVLAHEGRSPASILGGIDAVKFRSCLTLFAEADPAEPAFRRALDAFYGGVPDARTLALLGR